MDIAKDLHEMCETLSRELEEVNQKIRSSGGKMSSGDLEVVDKLTHALKSVKAVMAMEEGEGYSSMYPYMRGGSYAYAQRRDSRGRYSRNYGYSRAEEKAEMVAQLRDMMDNAPDENMRKRIDDLIRDFER